MWNLGEYRRRPASLADRLPYALFVRPGVMVNKDGSFMRVLTYRGPDLDSSTEAELIAARAQLNNALKRLGSRWCVHVEAARYRSDAYPDSRYPDTVSDWFDERRRVNARTDHQYETAYYLSLSYLTPTDRMGRAEALLYENKSEDTTNYAEELRGFLDTVDKLADILSATFADVALLDDDAVMTYLHGCVADRHVALRAPQSRMYLDAALTSADFLGGLQPKLGRKHLRLVTIHGFAPETYPGLLDAFNDLAFGFRWSTRYLPFDKRDAQKALNGQSRYWFAKRQGLASMVKQIFVKNEEVREDRYAVAMSDDADEALHLLNGDTASFGYLTTNIVVADEDVATVEHKARAVAAVIDNANLVGKIEDLNAVEAWLSTLPGHACANVRRPVVNSLNLADLLPMSAVWAGPSWCAHLDGPPLMVTRTRGSVPFRLNLHHGDVGHTLIVGPTGSGKSVLLATLALQWLRYAGAQVVIFDKERSSRGATLCVGGEFVDLGGDEMSFQPLRRIDRDDERVWAREWLIDLLADQGVPITPAVQDELWQALGQLAAEPAEARTLTLLRDIAQLDTIRDGVQPFCLGGPFGKLLDADTDRLADPRFQAFEMSTLMSTKRAVAPVLTYLFHRLERRFARPEDAATTGQRPTLLILDEAWLFLEHGAFGAKIREWLKVLRRRNVAVVFATQSLSDIARSGLRDALLDNCPTRVYLPNPAALEQDMAAQYGALGLNARQIELIAHGTPKRQYYYASRAGNRLFSLALDPALVALVGTSGEGSQALLDELVATHAPGRDLAAALLRRFGLDADADELWHHVDASERQAPLLEAAE